MFVFLNCLRFVSELDRNVEQFHHFPSLFDMLGATHTLKETFDIAEPHKLEEEYLYFIHHA